MATTSLLLSFAPLVLTGFVQKESQYVPAIHQVLIHVLFLIENQLSYEMEASISTTYRIVHNDMAKNKQNISIQILQQ